MSLSQHFQQLSRYNLWADKLLLQHLAPLTEDQYRQDCGLFFQSVHGTLNHLLLGHCAWYGRLSGEPFQFTSLDQELHNNRQLLTAALLEKSQNWIGFIDAMHPTRHEEVVTYRTSKGEEVSLPTAGLLTHVFNHASHHRGQVSAVISRFNHAVPAMDLVYFMLEQQGT